MEELNDQKIIENWKRIKVEGYSLSHLEIKFDPIKQMGVFAKRKILKNEIVEYCHSMVYGFRTRYHSDPTIIRYAYNSYCECNECRVHGSRRLTPFGFGSIYNSAENEKSKNIMYKIFPKASLIVFIATRDIEEKEELLSWWGQNYYDIWCKPA